MKASNIIKDRGEEMRILWCKLSTQLSSSIVLLEGGLGLIVNVYCKLLRNDLKIKKRSIIDILMVERKWTHLKCSIKTRKSKKEKKRKEGRKK